MEKLVKKYEAFKSMNSINKHEYIEEQLNELRNKKKHITDFKKEMNKLKNKKELKKELKENKINEGIIKKKKKSRN